MSRRFEGTNWIDAYCEYHNNGFIPPQFNTWCALSAVAGALERRVWLPWGDTYSFYPNVYIMLVSMPGDGKSVAIKGAIDLLLEVNKRTSQLNIMPNQVTEAKFIELMGHGRSFIEVKGGRELVHRQNAGYYWASEASNSLKNVFGDFIACLTDFYDCPVTWERATKKDGKKIVLNNVCMNLLAGSTVDYLGKLVSDENIMGGFASRLIYVVSENKVVEAQPFQNGQTAERDPARVLYHQALVEDLCNIAKLTGPMTADKEFGDAWEAWYPIYEKKRRSLASEKAQSILARANPNTLKVAMLLCAAEGDGLVMGIRHWERAKKLVESVQGETTGVFRKARAGASTRGPTSLTNMLIHSIKSKPGITIQQLVAQAVLQGYPHASVDKTINALSVSKVIGTGSTGSAVLLTDADDYL